MLAKKNVSIYVKVWLAFQYIQRHGLKQGYSVGVNHIICDMVSGIVKPNIIYAINFDQT